MTRGRKLAIGCGGVIGLLIIISIVSVIVSEPASTLDQTPTEEAGGESLPSTPTEEAGGEGLPPTPVEVELVEAVSRDLVEFSAFGMDTLEQILVELVSKSDDPLEVTVLPGTIFEAQSASVQSMVVIIEKVVLLQSRESTKSVTLSTACANMRLDMPSESDSLTLRMTPTEEDLVRLLNLPDFHEESFRVRQFAIWTITDNPERDGYVGIGYFGVGSGPDDEEIERIRTLFEKAGISTEKYRALY